MRVQCGCEASCDTTQLLSEVAPIRGRDSRRRGVLRCSALARVLCTRPYLHCSSSGSGAVVGRNMRSESLMEATQVRACFTVQRHALVRVFDVLRVASSQDVCGAWFLICDA